MPCSRSPGGCLVLGVTGLGGAWSGGMPAPGGVAFCCGLLLWPSGLVAF